MLCFVVVLSLYKYINIGGCSQVFIVVALLFCVRLHKFGIVGRRELDAYAFEYVQREARDERDGCHFPTELDRLNKLRIEIVAENKQRNDIGEQAEHHGEYHENVPSAYSERDHEKFG